MSGLNGGDYFSPGGYENWGDIEKGGSGGGRHSLDDDTLKKWLFIISIVLIVCLRGVGVFLALPLLYLAFVVGL